MAFAYTSTLTIDHTKCGSSNSANFPVVFEGHSKLATVANGGYARSASGYDIGFYADSSLTTKLAWETVSYDPTTGLGEWHVMVPTLSASVDTVFYVGVGDAAITTDQSNKTGVWDSTFAVVLHLPNGAASTAYDSTSHANNGTITAGSAATGKVGGGISLPGTAACGITIPNSSSLNPSYLSISFWIKVDSSQPSGYEVSKRTPYPSNSGYTMSGNDSQNFVVYTTNGSGVSQSFTLDATLGYGWVHVYGTYGADFKPRIYFNGSLRLNSFQDGIGPLYNNAVDLVIGSDSDSLGGNGMAAIYDEFRLANVARSADWILAEYNNQSSPTTFYSVGTWTAMSAPSSAVASALFLSLL